MSSVMFGNLKKILGAYRISEQLGLPTSIKQLPHTENDKTIVQVSARTYGHQEGDFFFFEK